MVRNDVLEESESFLLGISAQLTFALAGVSRTVQGSFSIPVYVSGLQRQLKRCVATIAIGEGPFQLLASCSHKYRNLAVCLQLVLCVGRKGGHRTLPPLGTLLTVNFSD